MTEPDDKPPAIIAFLRWTVRNRDSPERGILAALRRGAGREPGSVPEMYPYVERYLPADAPRSYADAAYLVAGLFALHPHDWRPAADEDRRRGRTLGTSLRRVRWRGDVHNAETEDRGVERRFIALLDARRDEISRHLRTVFTLMDARGDNVLVDYTRLLSDLQHWDHPDRWVQREWADGFWRGSPSAGEPAAGGVSPATDPGNDDDDDPDNGKETPGDS